MRSVDDSSPSYIENCKLWLQQDIVFKLHHLLLNYRIEHLRLITSSLRDIFKTMADETPKTEIINALIHETRLFAYEPLGMTRYLVLGLDGDISWYSRPSYLHRELVGAMIAAADVGDLYCSVVIKDNNPNKINVCHELYAFLKNLCFALRAELESDRLLLADGAMLSISSFKPLLQLHYSEEHRTKDQLQDYLIYSFVKVGNSLRKNQNKIEGEPEELTIIQMLHQLFTNAMMPKQQQIDALGVTIIMAELLCNLLELFHASDNFEGEDAEDLNTIVELKTEWCALLSNQEDIAALNICQRKVIKLQVLIMAIHHKCKGMDDSDDICKSVVTRANHVLTVVAKINCNKIRQQLQHLQQIPCEHNDWPIDGTNMELLVTYLFWLEKTLEVQMLRFELISPIEGRICSSITLDEPFLVTLLGSLDWVEEIGLMVTTMYSIIHYNVVGDEILIPVEDVYTWLSAELRYPSSVMFSAEEQEKAIQIMKDVSLQWQAEYYSIANKAIDETNSKEISLPSLFELFRG
jgi:hypothetical protein